ncbi:MAG TPA: hypothetical protein VGJ29_10140, partial [Vicinamibacterales bacterium]
AVLFLSAALHFFGGYRGGFPALAASNLDVQLQTAFRVVFLSVGWDWIVLGLVAVVAAFTAGARRRTLVMMCGVGILIEAVGDAFAMGLFIGNEMIGAAAILIVIGGALLDDGAQGALRGANLT